MDQFRKKPVVIEAVQITDQTFDAEHPNPEHLTGVVYDPVQRCVFIETLEGTHRGDIGDWIIRGIKGELYPCKPDIFAATYDQVNAGMNFGSAIAALKEGKKVSRAGWNGKGMWLILVPGTKSAKLREGTPYHTHLNMDECEILPHIDMWTINAEGRRAMLPGWLASQSDMLADDWQIVEDN